MVYREIVEPEPMTHLEECIDRQAKRLEAHRRGEAPYQTGNAPPRGQATIIRGSSKCKRLHFDVAQIGIGVVALLAIAFGGVRGWGVDAALVACGIALVLLTRSR